VNDLHGDLVNLARIIQHPKLGPALYRQLRRVLLAEALFDESADLIRDFKPPHCKSPLMLDPERAFNYFVTSWFGRNGVAGTSNYNAHFCRRFTKNGGHAATRWTSVVSSIPAWRRRLRSVTILCADGIDLCAKIEDAPGVVIYVDPPYLKKGADYLHEFDWLAHRRLATALRAFRKSRVVVSYYAHPDIEALYPKWTVVPLAATKALVNQGMRDRSGSTVAPEVLLINGPSFASNQGLTTYNDGEAEPCSS
jgi:DNA adenine methylase